MYISQQIILKLTFFFTNIYVCCLLLKCNETASKNLVIKKNCQLYYEFNKCDLVFSI